MGAGYIPQKNACNKYNALQRKHYRTVDRTLPHTKNGGRRTTRARRPPSRFPPPANQNRNTTPKPCEA